MAYLIKETNSINDITQKENVPPLSRHITTKSCLRNPKAEQWNNPSCCPGKGQ